MSAELEVDARGTVGDSIAGIALGVIFDELGLERESFLCICLLIFPVLSA